MAMDKKERIEKNVGLSGGGAKGEAKAVFVRQGLPSLLSDKRLGLFLRKKQESWKVNFSLYSDSSEIEPRTGKFTTHTRPTISGLIQMLLNK